MATKIVTKNSSTASAVPTASDLVQGELAVNVADKRLFTEDNTGTIVELGTNPSTINIDAGTIDGAVIGGNTPAAITGSTVTSTGNIVVSGTVDGRDVATDGTKLDGIEANADVTDTTNVTAAGALMDSEVANLAQVKAFDSSDYATAAQGTTADNALPKSGGAMTGAITTNSTFDGRDVSADGTKLDGIEAGATADQTAAEIKTAYESNADTNAFTDADHTKLDGIEASADVTDTANVTAAGALMDSELTSEASVKALNQGVATTDSPSFAGLTVDTDTLYVDSTNNRVGIGTTSPISELHVADATGNTSITMEASDTGSNFLLFGDVTDSNADTNGGRIVYSHATEHMQFNTNATERMRIDSSGRVGIGTTSPITALHIADTHPTVYLETSGGGSTDAGFLQKYSNDVYLYNKESAGNLYLGTNNATKVTLDSSGNVGIGTSSPSTAVHASGKIRAQKSGQASAYVQLSADELTSNYAADIFVNDTGLTFKHNSGSRGFVFDQNGSERMRIDSGGNLLVNTTSQVLGSKLSIVTNGSRGIGFNDSSGSTGTKAHIFASSGTEVGSISTTTSSTSFNTSSDQRLKENIADADDAGSKIDAIQVRQYDWKADGSHQDYGMIAQELVEVAPEAVTVPADSEEMMGVDYSKLVPMLIKEIQSLRNRVAQLEE